MNLVAIPDTRISIVVLVVLFVILIASSATFWLLNRRWTSHRQWVTLAEWARNAGFRVERCEAGRMPPPLDALSPSQPIILRLCLSTHQTTLAQAQTQPLQGESVHPAQPEPIIWNVAIRELETVWPPTGLRPAAATSSVLDLFSLSSFPLLGANDRLVVFGTETSAAATLSRSMARSLLPPDVGLLLHGSHLTLDFSQRPFDTLELDRVIALAEQLAEKLPIPS